MIMRYCVSGKEKITANGIRALSYMTLPVSCEMEQVLIEALSNRSPKIAWNSCVAISKFVAKGTGPRLNSLETSSLLFEIISSRPNLKSRI
jgi:hypothetical protein